MAKEPQSKTTVAFVDGQNLFHAAREAFGYTYPNYDVRALAETLCQTHGWQLAQVRASTQACLMPPTIPSGTVSGNESSP